MPDVIVPGDIKKLKQQIAALEYQMKCDTRVDDLRIHSKALQQLKAVLQERRVPSEPNGAERDYSD